MCMCMYMCVQYVHLCVLMIHDFEIMYICNVWTLRVDASFYVYVYVCAISQHGAWEIDALSGGY